MKKNNVNQPVQLPSGKKTAWNIVMTLFTVLTNVLVAYVLVYISNYAALSKNIFIWINVGFLVGLLIIDFLTFLSIRVMKTRFYVISAVALCLFLAFGGYGTYVATRVQTNIDNITSTVQEENVAAAFVIFSGNGGSVITDMSNLEGKKIAVCTGSQTAEIAEKKLQNNSITASYTEYPGYTEVFKALVTGEVDCAVLPTTWQSMFEEDTSLSQFLSQCSSILNFSDSVTDTNNQGADKDLTKEPFTILLTGENEGLADTIMLISVNPVSMKVTMSSIARDSYVPISCYGNAYSKINGAHASSESCMVDTVEQLTGVKIDYTIEFNFASVIQVVDAVGGVDVDISTGFDAQCWDVASDSLVVYHLDPGDNVHLNGTLALGFARERMAFADGDFARQRHQQEVIDQVLGKIMATKDPNTLLKVMDAAGDNIETNFTRDQLVNFISYAMQKANRFYGDKASDVFNVVHSRVYGYNGSIYDSSVGLDLYVYRLYQGSLTDTYNAIERNIDLNSAIGASTPVSWSAATEYEAPAISQEYYDESTVANVTKEDVEGPQETAATTDNTGSDATPVPTATPEATPIPEPTATPAEPVESPAGQ